MDSIGGKSNTDSEDGDREQMVGRRSRQVGIMIKNKVYGRLPGKQSTPWERILGRGAVELRRQEARDRHTYTHRIHINKRRILML